MANTNDAGVDALRRLQQIDPPSLLAPKSQTLLIEGYDAEGYDAEGYDATNLRPFSSKSPLDELLVEGYDAEQIWHQIDLQSQPLLSTLRRRLNQFVKNPEEIAFKVPLDVGKKTEIKKRVELEEEKIYDFDEELDDDDDDEDEDDFEGVEKKKAKGGSEGEDDLEEEDDDGEEGSEDEDP